MKTVTKISVLGVLIARSCFAAIDAVTPFYRADGRWAAFGPLENPDDQFRSMAGVHEKVLSMLVADGFNTANENVGNTTNVEIVADIAQRILTSNYRAGLGTILKFGFLGYSKDLKRQFPLVNRDGTPDPVEVDAANRGFVAYANESVTRVAQRLKGQPGLIGLQPCCEIFHRHPSYTADLSERYRAFCGREIPEEAVGRSPVGWKNILGFPADRVVADDYPVLDFYRWLWKKGDGWNDMQTVTADTFVREYGRPVLTMYAPILRAPPMWRSGGRISDIRHWTYVYPEPYGVAYDTLRQQAFARATGQGVHASIQSISYRSRIAPADEHPTDEPPWVKEFPNTKYPTTPPDLVQEAMWAVYARQVAGIGFHGWNSIYDGAIAGLPHDSWKYQCTNPETAKAISRIFHEVGIPLGPLFKAVPERNPTVAVVESYASVILRGQMAWDCSGKFRDCGILALAANLAPYSLNEEEIATRGIPPTVKVLLMADCDVLTRTAYDRIADFQAHGGRIVADDVLCPALTADARLPFVESAFRQKKDDHDDGISEKPKIEALERAANVARAAEDLRRAVGDQIVAGLYVDTSCRDLLASARSSGDADYVFVINDRRTYGDYVGQWKRVLEKGLPNRGEVTISRSAGAVYDLVKHQAVPFVTEDGQTRIPLAFETNDGRVLMVVSRPLSPLKVSYDGKSIRVSSADVDAMIPIEVAEEGAKPRYGVVAKGEWEKPFQSWTNIRVRNLASGEVFVAEGL